MASIEDTIDQINSALSDAGEHYTNYSCKTVSWDDVQRGTIGGSLSCWGANITDTRLYAKDGRQLFTVRGDNWNERLGKVTADDLALMASHDSKGGTGCDNLKPITLRTMLKDISKFGGYAGLRSVESIADDVLDEEISVRFQTTFLPVDEGEKTALEFAPEAYNYNTRDDANPRNLILLCTTQGLAVQQDGNGAKKLYHHVLDDGKVSRYWLEAESSKHKVGGSQQESKEERDDAINRGKATSTVIGTKGMGTRFNVLMTIQVPLEQKKELFRTDIPMLCGVPEFKGMRRRRLSMSREGKSSAARVSRGTKVDIWNGLTIKEPKRHPNEHITATIVMYYTCSGGVPSEEDVKAAIDDLEEMYHSVENGMLANRSFDFMKSELTVKDTIDIKEKMTNQPP
mmetsp:Transcript_248/g.330  ORF Transcript_248/g.330 Transcript_248/m.330 type:complete len:400 (-) Transcript_248:106-1305(-)